MREALEHCDAVVVDGGERVWPKLLDDFERGCLQRRYDGPRRGVFAAGTYARPRFELLAGRSFNRVTVQTSRGCPRACEFCGASLLIADGFRQKPVELAIAEFREALRWVERPFFELADDNSFLDKRWSLQFLRELRPLEIAFFAETDASVADDPELCDALASAGCKQVLIGFESPRAADLAGIDPVGWKRKRAPEIQRVVDTLQERGIRVNGCFVLGLDEQDTDVFEDLLSFVRQSGMSDVQFTVQTPFPGTPLYDRLARESRLLESQFWDRCTLFDVTFQPKRMSVEELEAGTRLLFERAYGDGGYDARIK